jgi:hypothetical protein
MEKMEKDNKNPYDYTIEEVASILEMSRDGVRKKVVKLGLGKWNGGWQLNRDDLKKLSIKSPRGRPKKIRLGE